MSPKITTVVPPPPPTATDAGPATAPAYGSKAFQGDATLKKVAAGAIPAIKQGAPRSDSVKTVQTALYSLGFLPNRTGIDGAFGPGTKAAIVAFQAKNGVAQTGALDPATLAAIDKSAGAQIAQLKAQTLPEGSKRGKYQIVADIANSGRTRLYVMGPGGKVVDRFLTSPGKSPYETQGNSFTIPQVLVRAPWNPPNSGWAQNAKQVPPGIDNPMGIAKLSLGAYSEYIHGIPPSEEAELGHAASHGCLRVSGSNVLKILEKYAEAGTKVTINRDAGQSAELEAKFQDAGARDNPTDAGREYMFGYASGELGRGQSYPG